jgi:ABC-type uncharacterized transport system substrate-binding protein
MRALRIIAALALLSGSRAVAADVLIVQSGRSAAYTESVNAFRSAWKGSGSTVVLSDYAEVDVVRLVKEEQPRIVLAVGDAAVAASRKVRQVPVVGVLSLALNLPKGGGSVAGIGVMPAPERYLELCRSMGAKRVGVVHDPARTGHYLQRARTAAKQAGIELVVREVRNPRDVPARLATLKGAVDALWMLPDTTAVTAETLEGWFLFSLEQKVPVVTFSSQYLAKGAAVSLDVDRAELGRQAAELAASLLEWNGLKPPEVDARKTEIHANATVVRNLGLELPPGAK